MFSSVYAGCLNGIEANLVRVEVDISTGLPGFSMVGLLGDEVREARERVQVALKNSGFDISPGKITVNLSPANLRKEGSGFDLPIAVGMLQSMGYFPADNTEGTLFVGELGLNGEIKPVTGVLPIVREAAGNGLRCCIVPGENVTEGSIIPGIQVRGASNLQQLVNYLAAETDAGRDLLLPVTACSLPELMARSRKQRYPDFSDVIGQENAKRAAEIAAAGFHNLLMSGPPGGGKSMIAGRIGAILPPLSSEECLEVSSIYSVMGMLSEERPLITERPFRSPHHTISGPALVGGGVRRPRPGDITLAHRGV